MFARIGVLKMTARKGSFFREWVEANERRNVRSAAISRLDEWVQSGLEHCPASRLLAKTVDQRRALVGFRLMGLCIEGC